MLQELKQLLEIGMEDTEQDTKLTWIIESSKSRLTLLLGGIDPPESMNPIIVEVSVIRFNRIGSEGMNSHSVEGESHSFLENDFEPFMGEIQAFLDAQKEAKRGKVRFL